MKRFNLNKKTPSEQDYNQVNYKTINEINETKSDNSSHNYGQIYEKKKHVKGHSGDQGEQGYKGNRGQRGYIGYQGDIGERGCKGDMGCPGHRGCPGCQGYPGPMGCTGEAGFDGLCGSKGCKGNKGYRGSSKGEKGPIGCTGPTGPPSDKIFNPQGESGPTGLTGCKGPTGDDAPIEIGDQGSPGEKGDSYPPQQFVKLHFGEYVAHHAQRQIGAIPDLNIEFNRPKLFGIISPPGYKRYLRYTDHATKIDEMTLLNGPHRPLSVYMRNKCVPPPANGKWESTSIWSTHIPACKLSSTKVIHTLTAGGLGFLQCLSFNGLQDNRIQVPIGGTNHILDITARPRNMYVRIIVSCPYNKVSDQEYPDLIGPWYKYINSRKDYTLRNTIKKMSEWIPISRLCQTVNLKGVKFYDMSKPGSVIYLGKYYIKSAVDIFGNPTNEPPFVNSSVSINDSISIIYQFSKTKFEQFIPTIALPDYYIEDKWEFYDNGLPGPTNYTNGYIEDPIDPTDNPNLNPSGFDNVNLKFKSLSFSVGVEFITAYSN